MLTMTIQAHTVADGTIGVANKVGHAVSDTVGCPTSTSG